MSELRPIFMIRLVADAAGIIHGGLAHVGMFGSNLRDALLDELAGPRLVGALLEDQPDRGQLRDGLRAQLLQARDALQHLFDRDGDELLDLGRGVAQRDRLDLDLRRRELGEDVDLGAGDRDGAEDHEARGDEDDEPAVAQAARDDPAHQSWPPLAAPISVLPELELGAVDLRRSRRDHARADGGPLAQEHAVAGDARRPRCARARTSARSGSCRRTRCRPSRTSAPRRGSPCRPRPRRRWPVARSMRSAPSCVRVTDTRSSGPPLTGVIFAGL